MTLLTAIQTAKKDVGIYRASLYILKNAQGLYYICATHEATQREIARRAVALVINMGSYVKVRPFPLLQNPMKK